MDNIGEFRIGNVFLYSTLDGSRIFDKPVIIDGVRRSQATFEASIDNKWVAIDLLNGIPLKEEMFEKLGFKLYDPGPVLKPAHPGLCYSTVARQKGKDGLNIANGKGLYFYKHLAGYWHIRDYPTHNRIIYLHQLQNLYFALTGDEIPIKS